MTKVDLMKTDFISWYTLLYFAFKEAEQCEIFNSLGLAFKVQA